MADQNLPVKMVIEKTGWSQGYIAAVRGGRANPMERLIEWAEVLGVDPVDLLSRAKQYPDPEVRETTGQGVAA